MAPDDATVLDLELTCDVCGHEWMECILAGWAQTCACPACGHPSPVDHLNFPDDEYDDDESADDDSTCYA